MAGLNPTSSINEMKAAQAFSKQSVVFDELYSTDKIVLYKRERVRAHVQQYAKPSGRILELNAGTGDDAIYFAQQGYSVHATDIAIGMQTVLEQKVIRKHLSDKITNEVCSYRTGNFIG